MTENAAAPDQHDNRVQVRTSAFWRLFPAGMRRRWWLFRPLDLIARHFPIWRPRRGLLVVRMDGIGDMMLFRRSLDDYADAFGVAAADITVLGCESWKPIAEQVFAGFRVVTIDEHAYARRPLYRLRVGLMVRRLAPETVVCDSYLRRAMMADSLVYVAGAPRSVVSMPYANEPTRAEFNFYLSQTDEIIDTGPYPTHEIIRHARFVSAVAGKTLPPKAPLVDWQGQGPDLAADGPYAVLNPGSNEHGRRWPFASYVEIAERLLAKGWRVVFVGTGDERWNEDLLTAVAKKAGVIDLTGRTSLPELMGLMRDASLVVSNDTGPAHLSIAVGAPSVVVVGGGHFTSFVPYPAEVTPANARFVFETMECYHCFWRCHKRASKFDVFPCVSAVTPDRVWQACEDLIDAPTEDRGGSDRRAS